MSEVNKPKTVIIDGNESMPSIEITVSRVYDGCELPSNIKVARYTVLKETALNEVVPSCQELLENILIEDDYLESNS